MNALLVVNRQLVQKIVLFDEAEEICEGIILEDDFAESKLPTTGGQRSRASSGLAKPLPEDPLSGYKRQWAVMVVLILIGILLGALA